MVYTQFKGWKFFNLCLILVLFLFTQKVPAQSAWANSDNGINKDNNASSFAECSLACNASVPEVANINEPVPFIPLVITTDCTETPSIFWDFGDGSFSNLSYPNHTYTLPGTFYWSMTATIEWIKCVTLGSISIIVPPCSVVCNATGANLGQVGTPVSFTSTVTTSHCSQTTYDWDFGDNSPHSAEANPEHNYMTEGAFEWTFTASSDGTSCTDKGTITMVTPPYITGSPIGLQNPFRIRVNGSNFHEDLKVYIGNDTNPWNDVYYKNSSVIILKKGWLLKERFSRGTSVSIKVVNGDGGTATTSFRR